jgi:hypothetical protein
MIIVPGETSGRHRTIALSAGKSGSWTKGQPPAASEPEPRGVLIDASSDLTKRAGVVAAVVGVSAQELDGEAGAVEAVQSFHRLR